MAIPGNPYAFYADRTKYPLENLETDLDGKIDPASHTHVLADISDYEEVDPPVIPGSKNWTVSLDNKDLTLNADAAIPVLEDVKYKFQLNEGYLGTILYKESIDKDWVDQYEGDWPKQYPKYWDCPAGGEVRFVIERINGENISTADLNQIGLIFIPFSISELEKDFLKEMETETIKCKQTVTTGTAPGDFYLTLYRRGHICTFLLDGYSPPMKTGGSGGYNNQDTWLIVHNSDWTDIDDPTVPKPIPDRCLPAISIGDFYVNSDQLTNAKTMWMSINNGDDRKGPDGVTDFKHGDLILWANSDVAQSYGVKVYATVTYACRGE